MSRFSTAAAAGFRYRWLVPGDVNGFFALAVDNLALLAAMSGILSGVFHLPSSLVFGRMIPGTAFGVLIGDLAYTALALRLARREQRDDVCAMPLGVDTPSMFGLCFGVIGPAWIATGDPDRTLAIATAVLAVMGGVKVVGAFFGEWIRRSLPRSALLGALAAVAIALICFFPMTRIITEPVGGLVALGVVLSTLIAGRRLPLRVPAMVGAVLLGTAAWAAAHALGAGAAAASTGGVGLQWAWPLPTRSWFDGLGASLPYIPLALPFALATLVGGIDNTESAAVAGDRYPTRDILLVEGVATLLAAWCGGVVQNTPYIGHPAYKRMGSRAGYTAATGLFIGLGAFSGIVAVLLSRLPEAVLVPVLVFVGLEISAQAFRETSRDHLPALVIAFIPAIAQLVLIHWNGLLAALHLAPGQLPPAQQDTHRALMLLANGFIVTAMLWSTLIIDLIDRRHGRALLICLAAAALTLFGVIHSPFPDGHLFVPDTSTPSSTWSLAAGYLLLAVVTWAIDRLDRTHPPLQSPPSP
jgi:adenine/guanine/hypoxanthine permease